MILFKSIKSFIAKRGNKEYNIADRVETNYENMSLSVDVKTKKLRDNAIDLQYKKKGDSGFDLYPIAYKNNHNDITEDYILEPGERILGLTGWAVELPENYEIQIRPTSGNSLKTKITVFLGTVDDNYRGELGVIIENSSNTYIELKSGQKLAQGVLSFVPKANFIDSEELNETDRGEDGYGSTGYIK